LIAIATPSASAISSLVALCLMAASVWVTMQPSQRSEMATPSAISSRVLASRCPVFWPTPLRPT